jgi:hypothetical protein
VISRLTLCAALLLTAGCQTKTPPNSGTASEVTTILKDVQGSVQDLKAKQDELLKAEADRKAAQAGRDQFISNHVNAAATVNSQNPQENEHTYIVGKELEPTLGLLPTPTAESQRQTMDNLKLALEKTEAARRELELNYELERRKAAELKTEVDKTSAAVAVKEAALKETTVKLDSTVSVLANKEAEVRIAAAEAERQAALARKEAASKTRMKVAYGFMGLGGLIAVAAVVATILRVPGVLHAGLAGGGSLLLVGWIITYVEDLLQHTWFQVTVGVILLIVLVITAWISLRAIKTRKKAILDEKISTGATAAIQELKNDDAKLNTAHYEPLKAKLSEWFVDDDGKPDVEIAKEIDQRLVQMNLVNPKA